MSDKPEKPVWKRWYVWIGFLLLVAWLIGSLSNGDKGRNQTSHLSSEETTSIEQEKKPSEVVPEWDLIGKFARVRTLYISPGGLEDRFFVAQVLHSVMSREDKTQVIQIMMFDDRQSTPKGLPMTDSQMLHLRAQYNFNPNTNHERFVWVAVDDPNSSPPKLKETEANIRPGYAE